MIFTDGNWLTLGDLRSMEGEIEIVADAQAISIADTIAAAVQETGQWLLARMQRWSGSQDPVLRWHSAATAPTFTESEQRPRISLSQVVVTDAELPAFRTAVATLTLYEALYQFYRNASRMADTDRYEEKRDYYRKEIVDKYRPRVMAEGVPVVGVPMPAPAALYEPRTGSWIVATVEDGGEQPEQTIDIALTWVDPSKPNAESGLSGRQTVNVPAGFHAQVDITRLNPPTGVAKAAQQPRVLVVTHRATHYNVWAGTAGGTLYLQTPEPVAIATKLWELPPVLEQTTEAGPGQWADRYLSLPQLMMRG